MSRAESELRLARVAAERARRILLDPSVSNLDRSRPLLEQACAGLEAIARSPEEHRRRWRPELLEGIGAMRLTVRRVAALLEGAARYRAGLFEALAAAAQGGYTRAGAPAASVPAGSLSIEG